MLDQLKTILRPEIKTFQETVTKILAHLTDLNRKSSNYQSYRAAIVDNPNAKMMKEVTRLPAVIHDGWMVVNRYLDMAYKIQLDSANSKIERYSLLPLADLIVGNLSQIFPVFTNWRILVSKVKQKPRKISFQTKKDFQVSFFWTAFGPSLTKICIVVSEEKSANP